MFMLEEMLYCVQKAAFTTLYFNLQTEMNGKARFLLAGHLLRKHRKIEGSVQYVGQQWQKIKHNDTIQIRRNSRSE